MSGPGEIAAAIVLVCAGKPVDPALIADGRVAKIKVPVSQDMLQAFRQDAPIAEIAFAGEGGAKHEWLVGGGGSATGQMKMLRLTKSGDPLSPFSFTAGNATRDGAGVWSFANEASGKCDLRPVKQQPEGSRP